MPHEQTVQNLGIQLTCEQQNNIRILITALFIITKYLKQQLCLKELDENIFSHHRIVNNHFIWEKSLCHGH